MKIHKLGAIDIGSNAIRFLIQDVYLSEKGEPVFNKETLIRVPIRLGKDVFTKGKVSGININRLVDAFQAFKLLADVYGVEKILAYATSALRTASNGKEVIEIIKEKTGMHLEVIDGIKEAELIFSTDLEKFLEDKNDYLFVDVGGGSTELTVLSKGKIITSKSFKVGTVRMLNSDVSKEFKDLKDWVKDKTKGYKVELIGSGGNINHTYKKSPRKDRKLEAKDIEEKYKLVKSLSVEQRMLELEMKPDRADVIEPALKIFHTIIQLSDAKVVHVPKIGVADGMIKYLFQQEFKS